MQESKKLDEIGISCALDTRKARFAGTTFQVPNQKRSSRWRLQQRVVVLDESFHTPDQVFDAD
jgi:hypothetical protein